MVVHSYVQCVMSYGWPPGSDTRWVRVRRAMDVCSSVRNVGELHRALRDWKCKGSTTGFSEGKFSLSCLSVDTSAIY